MPATAVGGRGAGGAAGRVGEATCHQLGGAEGMEGQAGGGAGGPELRGDWGDLQLEGCTTGHEVLCGGLAAPLPPRGNRQYHTDVQAVPMVNRTFPRADRKSPLPNYNVRLLKIK